MVLSKTLRYLNLEVRKSSKPSFQFSKVSQETSKPNWHIVSLSLLLKFGKIELPFKYLTMPLLAISRLEAIGSKSEYCTFPTNELKAEITSTFSIPNELQYFVIKFEVSVLFYANFFSFGIFFSSAKYSFCLNSKLFSFSPSNEIQINSSLKRTEKGIFPTKSCIFRRFLCCDFEQWNWIGIFVFLFGLKIIFWCNKSNENLRLFFWGASPML